jgi:hypothetical protein
VAKILPIGLRTRERCSSLNLSDHWSDSPITSSTIASKVVKPLRSDGRREGRASAWSRPAGAMEQ